MRSYEEQELHDEYMSYGDPRFCSRHPGEQITSNCGRFDAPCGRCEAQMDYEAELQERIEARTETAFDVAYINARFDAAARGDRT